MVLDVLNVDNFDFTRKIVKKNLGEKFVKMHKCLGFVKIEFLDKNLTFPIVCKIENCSNKRRNHFHHCCSRISESCESLGLLGKLG